MFKELILIIATILTAIFTLISINPIYSIIGLIMVFILSGSYLLLLSINFIGLSYFIIYVGAISILFLFAIMMLDTKYLKFTSIFSSISYTKYLPLAGIIIAGIIILYILYNIPKIPIEIIENKNLNNLNEYLNNIENTTYLNQQWDNLLISSNQIKAIGYSLYTHLSLWLLYISCILLLAMIGPIILCYKSFYI